MSFVNNFLYNNIALCAVNTVTADDLAKHEGSTSAATELTFHCVSESDSNYTELYSYGSNLQYSLKLELDGNVTPGWAT